MSEPRGTTSSFFSATMQGTCAEMLAALYDNAGGDPEANMARAKNLYNDGSGDDFIQEFEREYTRQFRGFLQSVLSEHRNAEGSLDVDGFLRHLQDAGFSVPTVHDPVLGRTTIVSRSATTNVMLDSAPRDRGSQRDTAMQSGTSRGAEADDQPPRTETDYTSPEDVETGVQTSLKPLKERFKALLGSLAGTIVRSGTGSQAPGETTD